MSERFLAPGSKVVIAKDCTTVWTQGKSNVEELPWQVTILSSPLRYWEKNFDAAFKPDALGAIKPLKFCWLTPGTMVKFLAVTCPISVSSKNPSIQSWLVPVTLMKATSRPNHTWTYITLIFKWGQRWSQAQVKNSEWKMHFWSQSQESINNQNLESWFFINEFLNNKWNCPAASWDGKKLRDHHECLHCKPFLSQGKNPGTPGLRGFVFFL